MGSYAGLYQDCTAAPINLGFEELTGTVITNPFTYDGLSFSGINPGEGASILFEKVTPSTETFAEIQSGAAALQGRFNPPSGPPVLPPTQQALVATDSNILNGGAYVAVSAYINGVGLAFRQSISINVTGVLATAPQPTCQSNSFPLNTPVGPPGGSPARVFFADQGNSCIVDTLTLSTTTFVALGTGTFGNIISLDDFVVCKANSASALQGALPG